MSPVTMADVINSLGEIFGAFITGLLKYFRQPPAAGPTFVLAKVGKTVSASKLASLPVAVTQPRLPCFVDRPVARTISADGRIFLMSGLGLFFKQLFGFDSLG